MKRTFFYAPRAELTERSQRKGKKGREGNCVLMLRTSSQKILQDAGTRHFARVPAARKKWLTTSAALTCCIPLVLGAHQVFRLSGAAPLWYSSARALFPRPSCLLSSTRSRARGTCAGGSCFRWSRGDSTASVRGSSPLALLRASPVEGRGLAVTSSGLRSPKVSSSLGVDHDVN